MHLSMVCFVIMFIAVLHEPGRTQPLLNDPAPVHVGDISAYPDPRDQKINPLVDRTGSAELYSRSNGISVSTDTGRLSGLLPPIAYHLPPHPDSSTTPPSGPCSPMKIVVSGTPGSILVMTLTLPEELTSEGNPNGLGCSWYPSALYLEDLDTTLDPNAPAAFQIDTDSSVVFYLGVDILHIDKGSRGEYSGVIVCSIVDTAINDTVTAVASYQAFVDKSPLELYAEEGEMYGLLKGYTYTLDPNPYNSPAVTPIIDGDENGNPMPLEVWGDPGARVRVSFSLPSRLHHSSGRSIPCSFGSSSAYDDGSGMTWNATFDTVITLDSGWSFQYLGSALFYLGMTVTIPDTALSGEYSDTVRCTASYVELDDNALPGIYLQSTVDAIYRVSVPSLLNIEMGDGEIFIEDPPFHWSEYTLIPGPGGDTVVPSGTGNSMEITVRGDPSTPARLTFILPHRLYSSDHSYVPCSWGVEALYREDTQEFIDPGAPLTFRFGADGKASFRLGILIGSPYPGEYAGQILCNVIDSAGGTNADGVGVYFATIDKNLQIHASGGELNNLSRGFTYTLNPNPEHTPHVTPSVNGKEDGTPVDFLIEGVWGAQVLAVFVLPTQLADTAGNHIPCSFSAGSGYWDSLAVTWDPNLGAMTELDINGHRQLHLGITVTVPDTAPDGSYVGEGIASVEYTGWSKTHRGKTFQVHVEFQITARVGVTTGIAAEPGTPGEFRLEQNYPNPFNSSTMIRFQVPAASNVSLSIYDMLGRNVILLVNEVLPPGVHTRGWDASGVPSGMYICRLQSYPVDANRTAGSAVTRKLVVLR